MFVFEWIFEKPNIIYSRKAYDFHSKLIRFTNLVLSAYRKLDYKVTLKSIFQKTELHAYKYQ